METFLKIVLGGGTLWHLQKFLKYIKNIILKFIPFTIKLSFFEPETMLRSGEGDKSQTSLEPGKVHKKLPYGHSLP
jgi:hypothetical protein